MKKPLPPRPSDLKLAGGDRAAAGVHERSGINSNEAIDRAVVGERRAERVDEDGREADRRIVGEHGRTGDGDTGREGGVLGERTAGEGLLGCRLRDPGQGQPREDRGDANVPPYPDHEPIGSSIDLSIESSLRGRCARRGAWAIAAQSHGVLTPAPRRISGTLI